MVEVYTLAAGKTAPDFSPPYEPPEADKAPEALVTFLYLLARDHLPAGFVEDLMMRAVTNPGGDYSNEHLAAYAEKVARHLSYDRTAVSS
jgi:hypothetical protein